MNKPAILDRAHRGLHAGTVRLHRGHHALMDAVAAYRPPTGPKQPQPDKPSGPDDKAAQDTTEPDQTEPEQEQDEKTPKKGAKKKTTKATKGDAKEAKGKKAAAADEKKKKEEEAPPLRLGPRRAARAISSWVSAGEGGWDSLIRIGLLLLAFGILAYFAAPLLAQLPLPAAVLLLVAVLLYDVAPRLSLLLGTIMIAFTADPFWTVVGAVLLVGTAFAPLLAPLLALALTASAIHPVLMWPVTLVWTLAAWRAGALPEEVQEEQPEALPEEVEEEPVEAAPLDPHVALIYWLGDLTRGDTGIHLSRLHELLTSNPGLESLTRREMRAWLDRHQIPVERTIRAGGVEGRSGVTRKAIEALLSPPLQALSQASPLAHAVQPKRGPESGMESAPDLRKSPYSPRAESGPESGPESGAEKAA
ncbi:hypothetical protein [Streptomyces microflavus]|uniref:hypothetical protein n=1 Tax=Streptomyces microflavus TaxID=1919 RepID=UPI00382C4A48